jgi:hypothetical protein
MNQVPPGPPLVRQCAPVLYFMRLILSSVLMVFMLLTGFSSASAAESNENYCAVSTVKSGSLGTARTLFQNSCANYKLLDCDPIRGGGWQCSSSVIGINAPNGTNITVVTPDTPAQTVVSTPEPAAQNSNSGECYVVATGLNQSKIAFAQRCADYQRNDCDPLGSNRWVCSSANVSSTQRYSEAQGGNPAVATDVQSHSHAVDTTAQQGNTRSDNTDTHGQTDNSSLTNTQIGRLAANDLLVLHYDNCPDKDDGHAIPAGKSVVEKYDINNVLAVNGTCGNSILNRFNSASNAVMKASWGTEYLDADGQRAAAVQKSTTRWASTLSNGADVWVAEGGQSDFTAAVVRQIESRYSNINLKRIHVIQHSAGSGAYNEDFTDSANLSYLKNKTTYQPIANGNVGGNGSADLNQQSFYFVSTARASRFSAEWNAGFRYLPPDCTLRTENCKLDFSDTVELLYIVDDKSTQNVNDFANNYLN